MKILGMRWAKLCNKRNKMRKNLTLYNLSDIYLYINKLYYLLEFLFYYESLYLIHYIIF